MAFEHSSGLPRAFDRIADTATEVARLVFAEGNFIEGSNLNELQTISTRQRQRTANMVARDGDRVSGGDIILDLDNSQAFLSSGTIYVRGDVRAIPAAVIGGLASTGEFQIGVRLQTALVTHVENTDLLGLDAGSEAEGEPTAAWEQETVVWSRFGDSTPGDFFPVYQIRDGAVIDQSPPADLTGINTAIARYDRDANGNYIVSGCYVTALGRVSTNQVFSVSEGIANIFGYKRERQYALRHAEPEAPDLELISAEPFTFSGPTGGSTTVTVLHAPISSISAVIVVKRITESIVRGVTAGGIDALTKPSVVAIETVTQSPTTYTLTTDYVKSGDSISWAPGGIEPAASSTYSVTYTYNEAVTPTSVTDTTFVATGGVNGTTGLVTYQSKLPRIDLLCLNQSGDTAYVKGVSSRIKAVAPPAPASLLKLAEISNDWLTIPAVANNGTFNYSYDRQRRFFEFLIRMAEAFDRSDKERDIIARDPVAKKGIFTDAFVDDNYRDPGAAQTAAITGTSLELAIDSVLIVDVGATPSFLNYTEEVLVSQTLQTSSMKINPYANFVPFPAGLEIEPPTDFWTEQSTVWTSPVTQQFLVPSGAGARDTHGDFARRSASTNSVPGSLTINDVISETQIPAAFLRQITVNWTIDGFGVGENLSTLTFDGVNVKPPGTQTADAFGQISGTFTIPAGIPVGRRLVKATGAAGSFCEAIFVGNGQIDVLTMRRVTFVPRAAPPPPPPIPVPNRSDPLAQTFTLIEGRHVAGVDVKLSVKGSGAKGIRVQLVETDNGLPTTTILAEKFVSLAAVSAGAILQPRFAMPVWCQAGREYAFVFLTDDNVHELAIARLGDVDPTTQKFVAAQPYTVGVLLASSNRITWTPIQDADLWFKVVGASFAPTSKTVDLWTGAFSNISDFFIAATVENPTEDDSVVFELIRASGQIIPVAPGQRYQFAEFVNETVSLRAILSGTAKTSPTLFPGTQLNAGRIRTSGTYVTKVFTMGTAIKVNAVFAQLIPAGASVTVECDNGGGSWNAMTLDVTDTLTGGWTEPRYIKTPFTAASGGRIRITLAGGPDKRPAIARLRAYSF
jgi:hypothetical protein